MVNMVFNIIMLTLLKVINDKDNGLLSLV